MVGESKIIQVSSEFHTNLDVAMHFLPSYHRIASSGMFMWALVSRMGLEVGAGVVWWVASRNIRRFEYFAGVKNIKQNMVLNTISHPHIAATRRHWCIKEIRGVGNGGSVMWQMQLMLLQGRRDVDAIASDGEWQICLWISQLIITHRVASAQCSRGYCRDVCATRFMCCKS